MDKREDIKREADYKYRMVDARKRFREDKKAALASTTSGFRAWARNAYNPAAVTGKLRDVVALLVLLFSIGIAGCSDNIQTTACEIYCGLGHFCANVPDGKCACAFTQPRSEVVLVDGVAK